MKLLLKRKHYSDTYTIGDLFVNGEFFCNTLEDKNRDINMNGVFDGDEKKVYSETCIPIGKYKMILNMSPKFKRKLLRLVDVPYFTGILIHRGNTAENTSGCILVGENNVKGKLLNSTEYEIKLVKMAEKAIGKGEELTIEII